MLRSNPWLLAATLSSCYFLAVTLINLFTLRRSRNIAPFVNGPLVSVILPARDEEENIRTSIESLLSQNYRNLEIIVVDDDSSDRTAEIAAEYAHTNPTLSLVSAGPLPAGWMGKQHACDMGVRHASGALFFLTDADVSHGPDSVGLAVAALVNRRAEFLSGYVHQRLNTLGERLIVPMTYIMTSLLLPLKLLTSRFFSDWGFAIGQYMIIRRRALDALGGYRALRESLVEDMAMARAVKSTGGKTVFIDAREVASCNMYNGYGDAFRGFAKSIFGAVGGRAWVLGLLAMAMLILVVYPFYLWVRTIVVSGLPGYPAFTPVLVFFISWFLTLWDRRIPAGAAFLYPISFANLVVLGLVSMLRTGFGAGIEWKGRLVRCGRPDLPDPQILNAVAFYRLVSFIVYAVVFAVVVAFNRIVFGLRVEGRRNLRLIEGGFFLISNHSLYLDPAIVAHAVFPRRTYFSALEETFSRPVLGSFIRLLGAFPLPEVSCMRRIIPAIEWALNRGKCVHFFPEGELAHYSRSPAEFNKGVFFLSHRFQVPVVPVTLVTRRRRLFGRLLWKPLIQVTVVIGKPLFPEEPRRDAVRLMAERARREIIQAIETTGQSGDTSSLRGV